MPRGWIVRRKYSGVGASVAAAGFLVSFRRLAAGGCAESSFAAAVPSSMMDSGLWPLRELILDVARVHATLAKSSALRSIDQVSRVRPGPHAGPMSLRHSVSGVVSSLSPTEVLLRYMSLANEGATNAVRQSATTSSCFPCPRERSQPSTLTPALTSLWPENSTSTIYTSWIRGKPPRFIECNAMRRSACSVSARCPGQILLKMTRLDSCTAESHVSGESCCTIGSSSLCPSPAGKSSKSAHGRRSRAARMSASVCCGSWPRGAPRGAPQASDCCGHRRSAVRSEMHINSPGTSARPWACRAGG
mmetsp:Transcript_52137/g.151510  ORF Transcript_52137/g.151510 Transcript_52137/m.151510 type:complete len:304 (-) Transcript_52137:829-1740(-)